jgi:hypothetical protein
MRQVERSAGVLVSIGELPTLLAHLDVKLLAHLDVKMSVRGWLRWL